MAEKFCVTLPKEIKMSDADAIAGALDSHQQYSREEWGRDAGMHSIIFKNGENDRVIVCGDEEDVKTFVDFLGRLNRKAAGLKRALLSKSRSK